MLRKTLFLALAVLLVSLATSSQVQAWGCAHAGFHASPAGGGYHAGYTHYGPVTGLQHGSTGGGYHAGGGAYQYGTHYGSYGGYSAGYVRRW